MSPGELLAGHASRYVRDALKQGPPRVPAAVRFAVRAIPDETIDDYRRRYPRDAERQVRQAEDELAGFVSLFGRRLAVGRPIDWLRDPLTHENWPAAKAMPIRSVPGDPKPVWELNRHQWLPRLALAWRLTGDERFRRDALSCLDSWIDQNPWRTGINWASPTELAIRLSSWWWTLRLLGSGALAGDRARQRFGESMFLQASHVAGHLSRGSSANNHLVAEATGLLLASDILGTERWRVAGESHLAAQAGRLIREDGTGAEQSVAYLIQTLEYYLVALTLSARLRRDGTVVRRLAAAARFLSALAGQDASLPAIGDDDSGLVCGLSPGFPRVASVIDALAIATGQAGLCRANCEEDPLLFWLGTPMPAAAPEGGAPGVPSGFPDGGYYRLDAAAAVPAAVLWFHCGPLGLAPLAGHAHCDALGLVVSSGGVELLTDSGTSTYDPKDGWRAFFRGTSAHSTVRVDGAEQSRYDGPFLVGDRTDARCTDWHPGESVTGEMRLHGGVRCSRRVRVVGGSAFEVTDVVEGEGDHLAELFFHAAPPATLGVGGGRVLIGRDGSRVAIRPPAECSTQLYYGDGVLPLGWSSGRYGEREPRFTAVSRVRFRDRATLVTLLETAPCAG